jgi:membrane protein required for colicin V production
MNHLDAVFLILGVFLIYRGYQKGFIQTLKTFLTLFGGVVLAYYLSENTLSILYPDTVSHAGWARLILFAVYMLLLFFLAHLISRGLSKLLEKISLKWMDQALGTMFGLVKTCALIFLFVSMVGGFNIHFLKKPIVTGFLVKRVYMMVRNLTDYNLAKKIRHMSPWKNY